MKTKQSGISRAVAAAAVFAAVLAFAAGARFASESYMDAMADAARKEIVATLTDRTGDLPGGAPVRLAIGAFEDETGAYAEDSATMRQLLFGNVSLDRKFDPAGLNEFDLEYAKVAGKRSPDKLTQAELKDLGSRTWSSYLFFARIREEEGRPFAQGYLLSLRRGVLISTPRLAINREVPQPERRPAPVEKSVEEIEPEKKPETPETVEAKPAPQEKTVVPAAGRVVFPAGEFTSESVLDIAAAGNPLNIFVLSSKSLDVYSYGKDGVKQTWIGNFKKAYPPRGLAGRIIAGNDAGMPTVVVSMNVFNKTFKYEWDGKQLKKDRNIDMIVAEWQPQMRLTLYGAYVPGGIAFAAKGSYLLDASLTPPKKISLGSVDDYNAACVMRGADGKSGPIRIVTADVSGRLHLFEPDGEKARSEAEYGGDVDCWTSPSGSVYLVTTTSGGKNDSIVLLAYYKNKLEERWRSKPIEGSIYRHTMIDANRDGSPEVLGVLEQKNGKGRLFIATPDYTGGTKQ